MSKKADLHRRIEALDEIKGIMTAMKNLSFLEINKLNRISTAQRQLAAEVEEAVSDFMSFYPIPAGTRPARMKQGLCLLVGSERGFCGGFNEMVLQRLERLLSREHKGIEATLMIVGSRLASKLPGTFRVGLSLPGPSVAEDVPQIITEAARYLGTIQARLEVLEPEFLTVIYNQESQTGIETCLIEPFARYLRPEAQRYPDPPLLNLPSRDLRVLLQDHYLFSVLHNVFYSSLMAEHRQRVRHMENAIGHLEKAVTKLSRRVHLMRQEDITEELEVIMLSALEPEAKSQL